MIEFNPIPVPLNVDQLTIWQFDAIDFPPKFDRALQLRWQQQSRKLCNEVLAAYLGVDIEALQWDYGYHGKPNLIGKPLEFNLTHAHGRALMVLHPTVAVGIDLEWLRRPLRSGAELQQRCCHTQEQAYLQRTQDKTQEFLRLWTLKEALTKAAGFGIQHAFEQMNVLPWLKKNSAPYSFLEDQFWVQEVAQDGDYCAYVAAAAPVASVNLHIVSVPFSEAL